MKLHGLSNSLQWATIAQVSKQVIQIGTVVVLAKILSPGDFGIIGLATTLVSFLNLFRDIGTSSAIIRAENAGHTMLSSIFWLNVGIGLAACLILCFSAPFIAAFFSQEGLTIVLRLLSLVFILNSFSIVQQAVLEKQLSFRKLAKVEIISVFLGSLAAIFIAYKYKSVICFPAQLLITSIVTSGILFFASGWYPSFLFSKNEIRAIGKYSAGLTGFGLVNYFARNLDNIIVGRFLGVTDLGYYSLAYKIMLFPIQNISAAINRVLFPALSRLQEDKPMREAYVKFLELIAFISFPLMVWIFIMDDLIVDVILGEKWSPVIVLIKIFVPIGLIQSLAYTTGSLFMLKSKTGILFTWGIVTTILIASSFVIGVRWGIVGVVVSYAIIYLPIAYFDFKIPFRFIGLSFREMLTGLKQPFFLCIKLGVFTLAIRFGLELLLPGRKQLVFVAVSILTGLFMLYFIRTIPALSSFIRGKETAKQS